VLAQTEQLDGPVLNTSFNIVQADMAPGSEICLVRRWARVLALPLIQNGEKSKNMDLQIPCPLIELVVREEMPRNPVIFVCHVFIRELCN
jgi:hypothetical protein